MKAENKKKLSTLTAEKLEVSKNTKQSQASIIKEPPKETKTVQVPITYEELTIE